MRPDEHLHPALVAAMRAAAAAYGRARAEHGRAELAGTVRMGADGTPTMLVDELVESAVLAALDSQRVNVLSEEVGFVDHGSAVTLVMDPVDGSANAAAGVPLCCFSAALAVDGAFEQAATCWFATGQVWHASLEAGAFGPDGSRLADPAVSAPPLAQAAVSLLRPHPGRPAEAGWHAVARACQRVRVLGCTALDIALVADGAVDAFADPGSNTHRLVDVAAGIVFDRAGAGVLVDVYGRPIEFDTDLSRRWSGLYAASRPLGEALAAVIRQAVPPPAAD